MSEHQLENQSQNTFSILYSNEEIITAASSALFSEMTVYPIQTAWTVLQRSPKKSDSIFQICQSISKESDGYRNFFKGFSISGVSAVACIFPYLSGADFSLTVCGDNHVGQAMQGPFAQLFSAPLWIPAAKLTELQQASIGESGQTFSQQTTFNKAKMIWKENGIRGFYRAALPQLCINSMNDALGFWLRSRILSFYTPEQKKQLIPQLFATWVGFASANAILTPLAIVETRVRIHESNRAAFPDKTFFCAAKTFIAEQKKYPHPRFLFQSASISALHGMVSSLPIIGEAVVSP